MTPAITPGLPELDTLRVLMVSTSYPRDSGDWRGRFIADMVAHVAGEPGVSLSLWSPPGLLPGGVTCATSTEDARWLAGLSERGGIAHALRGNFATGAQAAIGLLRRLYGAYRRPPVADVAHVNWLQNALPLWGTTTPALVTVLGADIGMLRLPGVASALRVVFRQRTTILAPNARWMVDPLNRLFGDVARVRSIPFGVAERWFGVQRNAEAAAGGRWLAVTRITRAKVGVLFDWGRAHFSHGLALDLLGPKQEDAVIPGWVNFHGPTHPEDLQSHWFPSATGLITLSCHNEGRPQAILEAMAAGLPVIASDLPAHRDLIRHRETGWIATSPDSLAEGLAYLGDPGNNHRVGENARRWARSEVGTWDDCARHYAAAYRELHTAKVEPIDAQAPARKGGE